MSNSHLLAFFSLACIVYETYKMFGYVLLILLLQLIKAQQWQMTGEWWYMHRSNPEENSYLQLQWRHQWLLQFQNLFRRQDGLLWEEFLRRNESNNIWGLQISSIQFFFFFFSNSSWFIRPFDVVWSLMEVQVRDICIYIYTSAK